MTEGRTLVLMRHARAEPANHLGDRLRPLAKHGRRQASQQGPRLAELAGPFDVALVSSALRAAETYRLLAARTTMYPTPRLLDEFYEVGARPLLESLRHLPESARRVIVVGHEPTMSSLAGMLHDVRDELVPQLAVGIPVATACIVDVGVGWGQLDRRRGHVRGIIRPEE
ncbi:MAG: SixA phosphatase family protein [Actinomycetota bacterium]